MSDLNLIEKLNAEFDAEKKKIITDFTKDLAAKEQELKDYKEKTAADIVESTYKSKITVMDKELKEFKAKERDKTFSDFMTGLEKKGLIAKDGKEEMNKLCKNFSAEQIGTIDKIMGKLSTKDFKAKKGEEKGKSFSDKKKDLEKKITTLEDAGVGGPVLKEYQKELKKLEGDKE